MNSVSKNETLKVNLRQKEYYNKPGADKNFITSIWSFVREKVLSDFRKSSGIKDRVYQEHKLWMGDLTNKKILDLGCLRGNALSIYMAKNSAGYLGIDLSDVAIEKLKRKLVKNECHNAKAVAIDFYSENFSDRNFDIIYAYGVIHHFPDLEQLFARVKQVLKPGGLLITYDPMQTSLPVRILRNVYRPFQSDKDWEWPFDKKALQKINQQFEVTAIHGVLGKSKWAFVLNFLPLPGKSKMISKMIEADWNVNGINEDLYACMQVTMCLKN